MHVINWYSVLVSLVILIVILKVPLIKIMSFFPLVKLQNHTFPVEKNGTIMSPNYPGKYPTDEIHTYRIRVQPHFIVRLIFDYFDTEEGYDFVDVSNHN